MIGPGGEASIEFNPETQRDPNTQVKSTDVQTQSGIYLPGGSEVASQYQATQQQGGQEGSAVDAAAGLVQPEGQVEQPFQEEDGLEAAQKKTTQERVEDNEQNLIDIEDHPSMTASTSEDFIESHVDPDDTPEEAEEKREKARKWLDRAKEIAGVGFDEFVEANKSGNMDDFIKAFLVFGTEGKFGTKNPETMKGTEADNILLSEIGKNPAYMIAALEQAFSSNGLYENISRFENIGTDMDKLADFIRYFNEQAGKSDDNWKKLSKGLISFIDPSGQKGYELSEKTKLIFQQLESADALRSFLGLETTETSNEGDTGSDDQSGGDTAQQRSASQTPTQPVNQTEAAA